MTQSGRTCAPAGKFLVVMTNTTDEVIGSVDHYDEMADALSLAERTNRLGRPEGSDAIYRVVDDQGNFCQAA